MEYTLIYKTKEFASLMKKEALMDDDLIQACKELKQGLFDAALGNHLYKKRVPMGHKGKRAGYRTLIGTMLADDYFFLYAFAKNKQGNISLREQLALKKLALYDFKVIIIRCNSQTEQQKQRVGYK
ncbi:type II toxin-antitoxin system RelE/ParE family toxin [Marinomonas agarivorans]|nr:type II toxin-antitoxin system RelE/ParE family toxin [Marinomonas agarivorans]